MQENTSPTPFFQDGEILAQTLSDEQLDELLVDQWPVYMDDEYAFYYVDHKIVVAPVSYIYDTAVREAGFDTEPLRHCVAELLRYLYARMLEDPVKGFTHGEWQAVDRAHELLGIERKYRGESS